ncbi:class I SAM-dependent methyltransferase [Candidatus Micrarchaeota archaeon]|nr:class I SAM-dependent methyltransferase [Candidatus Micrarchaeota archaeon]
MERFQYEEIARMERTNWWYVSRRKILKSIIKKYNLKGKCLDIGCGVGANFPVLKKNFKEVWGIDSSEEVFKYLKDKENILLADAQDLPFKNEEFDFVIIMDVIEHVEDQKKTVAELLRVTKKGGYVFASVPAFMLLWSSNDETGGHKLRFRRKDFEELFKGKFDMILSSYWNLISFFPLLFVSKTESFFKRKNPNTLSSVPSFFNFILINLLKIENWLFLHNLRIPFGTSVFLLAKKK